MCNCNDCMYKRGENWCKNEMNKSNSCDYNKNNDCEYYFSNDDWATLCEMCLLEIE